MVKISFEGALRAEGLICLIILELVNLVISLERAKGMLDKNEQLQNMTEQTVLIKHGPTHLNQL